MSSPPIQSSMASGGPMSSSQNASSSGPGPSGGATATNTASAGATAGASGSTKTNLQEMQPVLTKPRLLELVREVDPSAQLDEDVEELLLQMADDFVEDVVKATCNFAKHRKMPRVEVRDVQLHLERKFNMWIPGFGTDELRPYKRAAITEAHKQRLALIRKTIKKY